MRNTIFSSMRFRLLFSAILLILSCSSEDDTVSISTDSFYKDAQVNADLTLLNRYWSIYEVNFDGKTASVPENFTNCDRDFFTLEPNGTYKEYLITDSGCVPEEQDLNWSFDNGVITLTNSFKDFNEMVVVELTAQQFIFRAKFDVNEDGVDDILQFLARPYAPNEQNFYQNSIQWDGSITNRIKLEWSEYDGINSFDRYEILLSTDNCNINNASLLSSITDKGTTSFEDSDPPQAEQLCYFIKIYTDKGILFQSTAASISPEFLDVPGVALKTPEVSENSITLNWDKYQGLYFSHYELVAKNYIDGFAQAYQEEIVAQFTDINETSFTDNTPPLVKNPVYEIKVYNTFGKQNFYNSQMVKTVQETNFVSDRIIDILDIYHFTYDISEPIIYLFSSVERTQEKRIVRYNYSTNEIESISNITLNFSSNKEMRLIESNGTKELMFLGNNRLLVFDAQSLEYKYDLENNEIRTIDDFIYLGNNIFSLINDEFIYTISRDFANTSLIDTQVHFQSQQNSNNYLHQILKISNDRILIGNANQSQSIAFNYDSQGNLSNKETINIPVLSTYQEETLFNETDNTLINLMENRIYSLADYSVESFEQPYFPTSLISNGVEIIGTNNDPDWYIDNESLHEKSTKIFNLQNKSLNSIETDGYPHLYFENLSGELFSISTYFKRNLPSTSYDKSDFFIEKIK
ncbi:MAG: lipocalin family protein [Maribacter sp.]